MPYPAGPTRPETRLGEQSVAVQEAPRSRREARERAALGGHERAARGGHERTVRGSRGQTGWTPQSRAEARALREAGSQRGQAQAPQSGAESHAPQSRAEARALREAGSQRGQARAPRSRAEARALREARAARGGGVRRARSGTRPTPGAPGRAGDLRTTRSVEAIPQSRREAKALAALAHDSASRSVTQRVVAPLMVTALVAAGGISALVGLPTKVAAGIPGQQSAVAAAADRGPALSGGLVSASIAASPVSANDAAASDLRESSASASRGSMDRLTLAWGTAAAAEGRRLMTTRAHAMESSITAGVTVTDEARAEAREIAQALAFHEPILDGRRTSGFGWRWGRMHNGTDYGADIGTPLYAVGQGTVTTASWNSGLGYHVKITLDTGEVIVYGHMSRITAEVGDRVQPGTQIGAVGSTGRSTGAHLHLEVRTEDGPIDPIPWLESRRSS